MHSSTRRFALLSALASIFACLLFTPGLPGEFVFDDIPNIVNNETIQLKELSFDGLAKPIALPQASGQMRGLPTLSFAIDVWRGGGEAKPEVFRATNIFIHALTTLSLAWLFRILLLTTGTPERRAHWIAIALTLAWAAHPLLVSSVLYAVQRLQTMGTLFLVLALLTYLQARRAQIAGLSGRTQLLGSALLWVLALACKEDSVQLPAYTLALELTVLRFAAQDTQLAQNIKRFYLISTLLGLFLYFFIAVPHYWSWANYDGRNFSTPERLLTEARVLCMYIWQIIFPLPSNMPFYYDWLVPSHGLLQPWTTLTSLIFIISLLAIAWRIRTKLPLISLGIFLFFGAHFIPSNVIGLELAFEHRNHFALIGAALAIGNTLLLLAQKTNISKNFQIITGCTILILLSSATILHAHSWNNNFLLAKATTQAAPHSARAWILLCTDLLKTGGDLTPNNIHINQAITACNNGATLAPYSLNNVALLIVLKSIKGDLTERDWALFHNRLETVNMSWDNQRAPLILTYNSIKGVNLDKAQLLKTMATLSRRSNLKTYQTAEIGYYIMNELNEPDIAMPYFIKAIRKSPKEDRFPQKLRQELLKIGRPDLAETIELEDWKKQNS